MCHANFRKNSLLGTQKSAGGIQAVGELNSPFAIWASHFIFILKIWFQVFRDDPEGKCVYIAPLKALVRERISDWKIRFEQKLGKKVVELTGDITPDVRAILQASVIGK